MDELDIVQEGTIKQRHDTLIGASCVVLGYYIHPIPTECSAYEKAANGRKIKIRK